MQFDSEGRGFSFQRDEPLDMRMDRSGGESAADLVAHASEQELADAIFEYGEERFSRRIARRHRPRAQRRSRFVTTGRLAAIVRRAMPTRGYQRIDPATRTFQALRIWVNRELDGLDVFITAVAHRLREGARFVVISFHSLEDRIAKHTLPRTGQDRRTRPCTCSRRDPVTASDDELQRNPRARSAKLRAAERVA